jgi:hypothetical protein
VERSQSLNGLALSADGTILVVGDSYPAHARLPRRRARRAARGGSVTNASAGRIFKFGITWRDDDGVDLDSLDNGDLEILTPTGGRLIARVIS